MHHMRNVEANTAIPPMYTTPILPQQPQPQPTIHPMNPPANNNLMVMLSHMQQQQQQQQHFNQVRKILTCLISNSVKMYNNFSKLILNTIFMLYHLNPWLNRWIHFIH